MSKAKGQREKPITPQWVEDHHKETAEKVVEFARAVNNPNSTPILFPVMDGGVFSALQWWGVQDDKGNWAFASGHIVHYPCEAIATAHAGTLSPRWKAVAFG